jgi:hypothetical protein
VLGRVGPCRRLDQRVATAGFDPFIIDRRTYRLNGHR